MPYHSKRIQSFCPVDTTFWVVRSLIFLISFLSCLYLPGNVVDEEHPWRLWSFEGSLGIRLEEMDRGEDEGAKKRRC